MFRIWLRATYLAGGVRIEIPVFVTPKRVVVHL